MHVPNCLHSLLLLIVCPQTLKPDILDAFSVKKYCNSRTKKYVNQNSATNPSFKRKIKTVTVRREVLTEGH